MKNKPTPETCRGLVKLIASNAIASANLPAAEVMVTRVNGRVVKWDCPLASGQVDCGAHGYAVLLDHQGARVAADVCRCRFATESV